MIPMVRCSRARCLTRCCRRDANDSAIRECCLGCTCPSLAPNLPQIGRKLGSRLVLFGTVSNSGAYCWPFGGVVAAVRVAATS